MMQKLRDPKNVKMISLFVAAIFVLGCFALTLTQSGVNSVASAASSESAIGVVNYQMLLSQVPDLQNVQTSMKQEIDNAQKDFDEKSKTMNDTEKQRYYQQLQERLSNKEKELMDCHTNHQQSSQQNRQHRTAERIGFIGSSQRKAFFQEAGASGDTASKADERHIRIQVTGRHP